MRKLILLFCICISTSVLAKSDLDDLFQNYGLVDEAYNIKDRKKYADFFRDMNKENVEMMPLHIDADRRVLSLNISPKSFVTIMQIDGIKDESDLVPQNWLKTSIKNFCSGSYATSTTILKDGGMVVTATIVNDNHENIHTISFNSKDCVEKN